MHIYSILCSALTRWRGGGYGRIEQCDNVAEWWWGEGMVMNTYGFVLCEEQCEIGGGS